MRPGTLVRLALAGSRTDTIRVVLTGLTASLATLAYLAALTVIAIPTVRDGGSNVSPQYRNALLAEAGLRPGVVITLVLLTIPVLALAGQCARLGAPARDRRLAAIRLAGASPRQAVAIAAAETGLASVLGVLVGLGVYFAGRPLLHRPDAGGKLPLPTDVLPPAWEIAAVGVGIPVLAALVAVALLRRVAVTPFGVVRRVRRKRPLPWPGLLIAIGFAAFLAATPVARSTHNAAATFALLLVMLGLVGATTGVVLGTGWISYTTGWLLHRFGRRPAALLAGRRLMADPWNGSRTLAALLACLLFGGAVAGVRASFATQFALEAEVARESARLEGTPYLEPRDTDFYFRALDLVNVALAVALAIAAGGLVVALAESVVSRRRQYASLVATGVPRGTLARALVWQSVAPAFFGIMLALGVGAGLAKGMFGETSSGSVTFCGPSGECVETGEVVRAVPIPVDDLALFAGGAMAAVLVVVGAGLLLLRSSTSVEELRV